jgi:hypothetical protein
MLVRCSVKPLMLQFLSTMPLCSTQAVPGNTCYCAAVTALLQTPPASWMAHPLPAGALRGENWFKSTLIALIQASDWRYPLSLSSAVLRCALLPAALLHPPPLLPHGWQVCRQAAAMAGRVWARQVSALGCKLAGSSIKKAKQMSRPECEPLNAADSAMQAATSATAATAAAAQQAP